MKRSRTLFLFFVLLLPAAGGFYLYASQKGDDVSPSPENENRGIDISGKINAPDFVGADGWLNVEKPLSIKDLRGKVVLLDFWTYCCINCMHIIPDLKKLEAKYPRELMVIGVHSAKFQNEKDTENIRSAVLRYEIEHPVVNDAQFKIWGQYGARGWPHMVIIDPEGKIVGALSGEGNYEVLDEVIRRLIAKFEGRINTDFIPLALEKDKQPPTVLSYPGKVLADEETGRLFIADTNHNRILITDLRGKVLDMAGQGSIGLKDGAFEDALFNHPQGMVRVGEWLYVADTENHAIRRLHLAKRTVETAAGTGEQGRWGAEGGEAAKSKLNSPWDLTTCGNDPKIYIAMAGPHQVWTLDPKTNQVEPFAGSGREDIVDGPAPDAALAQPSGIVSDGTHLYFADSEVSALRGVDFSGREPRVKTYIGTGLFDFGDADGPFAKALLQHPLGVAYRDGKVYIADTYNHKIKVADVAAQTIATLIGSGKPGVGTAEAPQLYEPGGLSFAGDRLYIADTNNNAVRVYDLKSKQLQTLPIDLSDWNRRNREIAFEVFGQPTPMILQDVPVPAEGDVTITFAFPDGYHFNEAAPPTVQVRMTGKDAQTWISEPLTPEVKEDRLHFVLPKSGLSDPEKTELTVTYYYCRTDQQGQCMIGSALWQAPATSGGEPVTLRYKVEG